MQCDTLIIMDNYGRPPLPPLEGSIDPDPEIDASPAIRPTVEQIGITTMCCVTQQLLQHVSFLGFSSFSLPALCFTRIIHQGRETGRFVSNKKPSLTQTLCAHRDEFQIE